MTVTPIKNGGVAIIQDLDDCYYYIHEYMGKEFHDEMKLCVELINLQLINLQEDLEATEQEFQSYEASLESAQRALMDIKEIVENMADIPRVAQSQKALNALNDIIRIINEEV